MLEKIKNLKWHFQLMLLVTVAAVLYTGVWYFYTSETRAETAKLTDEVAVLQAKRVSDFVNVRFTPGMSAA